MAKGGKKAANKKKNKEDLFNSADEDDSKFDLGKAAAAAAPQSDEEEPAPTSKKSGKKQAIKFDALLDAENNGDDDDDEDLKPKAKDAKSKRKPTASFDALAEPEEPEEEEAPKPAKKDSKKKSKSSAAASGFDALMSESNDQEEPSQDEEELELSKSKKKKDSKKKSKKDSPSAANDFDALMEDEGQNGGDDQTSQNNDEDVADSMADLSLGKKKRAKKDRSSKKSSKKSGAADSNNASDNEQDDGEGKPASNAPQGQFSRQTDHLTATGILLSHERSKDVQIDKFSLAAYGQQLVKDTSLHLVYGRKYGLVGPNGCGKSTLLRCLAHRHVPIQNNVDIYLLEQEYDPTELTAVQAVVDIVEQERNVLEAEQDALLETIEGAESVRFEYIQERLQELDLAVAEQKARAVLAGLGFTEEMQDQKTKEFSGGWRMRVALARALFVKPTCLLLDDATNHLDLSAVVWLEDYLQHYPHTIVMVSHSQDLLNSVCSDILYMSPVRALEQFSGNYDTFVKVKAELDENARKRYKADMKQLQKIKENLSRSGAQAKQAKSHQKALQKRMDSNKKGDEEAPVFDHTLLLPERKLEIRFQECGGGLPSPFLKFNDVSFAYPGRPLIYRDLNFGIDLNSRVALVGPNGAGKSTLMKLMCGDLEASSGTVYRHHHLRVAKFHQHLTEQLNMSLSAVEWMCHQFPEVKFQEMRAVVGKFGLTGKSQTIPMEQLSDGQRRRVVFSWLAKKNCHLLLLDEPTNFLDPETIDALAEGIREFDGGVVLISHDFRLIDQVAEEIWVVEDGTVEEWEGDIREYKEYMKKKVKLSEH